MLRENSVSSALSRAFTPLYSLTLFCICSLTFLSRLMSLVRYESIIHEFDPQAQYKWTIYIKEFGTTRFMQWFDTLTWYPIARLVAPSVYPGLMYTALAIYSICTLVLKLPINLKEACVFTGPFMAVVGCFVCYDMGYQLHLSISGLHRQKRGLNYNDENTKRGSIMTGILCAFFFSIVPGFIQRSVAGSFDNEANSITALILGFGLWIRSSYANELVTPFAAAIVYYYMATSWGGYVFILCLVPLHVFLSILCKVDTHELRRSYKVWFFIGYSLIGTIWRESTSMFSSVTYLPSIFVIFCVYLRELWPNFRNNRDLKRKLVIIILALIILSLPVLWKLGIISRLTGRLYAFINPTYARKHIPIIASVSEHQPSNWSSFYFNVWHLLLLTPVSLYFLLSRPITVPSLFLICYVATTIWFSAVMARMILIMAPACALCAAYAIVTILENTITLVKSSIESDVNNYCNKDEMKKSNKNEEENEKIKKGKKISLILSSLLYLSVALGIMFIFIFGFLRHSLFCAKEVYSSPTIVLAGKTKEGSLQIIDDYREAYSWLEQNTNENSVIASWWDYGYQIGHMSNRRTVTDNNTRSSFWIGLIAVILGQDEDTSWRLCREFGVDYVLIMFGSLVGQTSDELNKFLWPVRIAGGNHYEERYDWLEPMADTMYLTKNGVYSVNANLAPKKLKESTIYKMSYYKTDKLMQGGVFTDKIRQDAPVDSKSANTLSNFEEVFTSEKMMVRIFKVKEPYNF